MGLVAQVPHIPRPGGRVQGGTGSIRAGAQPSLPHRDEMDGLLACGERS
jgi:hypothetical protein